MLKKLQIKFVCINMLIVVVMLCIILGLVFHFTAKSLESESIRVMESIAEARKKPDIPGRGNPEVRLPYFELHLGRQGEILVLDNGYFDLSNEDTLAQIVAEAISSGEQTGKLTSHQLRFLRTGGPKGDRIIFVDTSSEDTAIRSLIRNGILISIASIILFFGLSILFAKWAVKPVAQAWAQQKQFVADASHELKTPLTVIMTSAELLLDPNQTSEDRKQSASRIMTMSNQMRKLVEGLLDLARADNGTARMAFSDTDLSQLIENTVLTFEPLYFEQGLDLLADIQGEIVLSCSPDHLHQVCEILLDNAMKYSTPGGEIRVILRIQGSCAHLRVSSPGQTISPADLKNIFKRFYRLDKARSRDGSHGLGLSIAEAIVTAHRGKIWAESLDGTNTFHVQLPM